MNLRRITSVTSCLLAAVAIAFAQGGTATAAVADDPATSQAAQPTPDGNAQVLTACGSTPVSSFSYGWEGLTFSIPTGVFFSHCIYGAGLTASDDYGSIDRVGPGYLAGRFCNWRIDFKYYNVNGTNYQTNTGSTHNSCDWTPDRHRYQSFNMQSGTACAVLYVVGQERARQCHNIVP